MPSSPRERNFLLGHTLLWTSVILLLYIDLTLIWVELAILSIWCKASTCSDPAALSKLYLLSYIFFFNVILFIVLLYYYLRGRIRPKQHLFPGIRPFLTGIHVVSLIAAIAILVFRILIQPCKNRYNFIRYGAIHLYETLHYFISCPRWFLRNGYKVLRFIVVFLPFTAIFTFLAFFLSSIIPVILQALVYPFRIVAAYSFYTTNFMVLFLVTFLVNYIWKRKGLKSTSIQLCFLLTLTPIAVIFIFMINIPFVSLYQLLSSGTLTNNPVTLGIISVAPTLLLSSPLVWLLKNKIVPAFVEGDIESEVEEGVADREGEGEEGETDREGEREEGASREDGGEGESQERVEMSAVVVAGDVTESHTPALSDETKM